jgi:hypothetical protein
LEKFWHSPWVELATVYIGGSPFEQQFCPFAAMIL